MTMTFPGRQAIERSFPPGSFDGKSDVEVECAWLRQMCEVSESHLAFVRTSDAKAIAEARSETAEALRRLDSALAELRSHSYWGC